jgi:hypothetical protein
MADIHSPGRMPLENLAWNKARIEIIARLLLLLAPRQTINFSTLAHALSSPAQIEPSHKRPQRFFLEIEPHYSGLPRLSPDYSVYLDRTRRRSIHAPESRVC